MASLRVLTANIHKGFSMSSRRFVLPELREAIRAERADLVFLQEVLGEHSGHSRRHPAWPAVPHYEYLADTLWPQFAYGKNAAYPAGHHGNALLSRHPILQQVNRDVSIAGHESRGVLHCTLALPDGRELHTLCVHLGLREAHRRRQLDLLCRIVHEEVPADAPLIVAGDFNDWRRRGHARVEACGLHEVFERSSGRLAATFPARWPVLPLDRIYLRHAWASQARVLADRPWSRLSDHATLFACVELDPPAGGAA
ncbi:endonuclease/exonuclease/phosphatase family protein [Vulcaniibacterium tengchongense]|uniref:Endonuclease/exonuclease/phosphatase family metal-dependent hydrolase n=1 Tax=Vulcaniibacterium tengchongense TaxID=1273429 RepID=A0A3N4V373_9GAMM|nr:endonuclease/exonuclease/phosphatase family protein [Vulcaniibacterium tengchongense]RPE76928.1 endonuclease/exonuclease/phosphatase family metal-dependent hydrolase [Vulcaniibacterium tengchongense]